MPLAVAGLLVAVGFGLSTSYIALKGLARERKREVDPSTNSHDAPSGGD